jgi:hypothetical protein
MAALALPGGTSIWVLLLVVAGFIGLIVVSSFSPFAKYRTVIFSVPGELLIRLSEVLNHIAPQGLRPSEALKMAVEDNTGDPRPAAEVFGYKAEAFEVGVRRIVGK